MIQGAHYEPWRNRESSRYAYRRIDTIADHLHFIGKGNVRDGIGSAEEDSAGGGHAHCGTMVYLGDNWPDQYRNTVFMNNIHGRRINNDLLQRVGSGYVATHAADVMRSQDSWFMGVTLAYGPDGGVFVSDWSDTGECHSVRNTRKHTGRIYKIVYGQPEKPTSNVAALSNDQLVALHQLKNEWYVRHARRILQERAHHGQDLSKVHDQLLGLMDDGESTALRLRAMWTLHATGGMPETRLESALADADPYVRAWAVRLLCEGRDPSDAVLERFVELASAGDSPFVRLHLASALQRIELNRRWDLAAALVARAEDADDQNLPLIIWYGIEPLVKVDLARFVQLAAAAKIPLIQQHIARRASSL